jgi:hypothetical protein
MKNIIIAIIFFSCPLVIFSQNYSDLIMKKITDDEGYLFNVKYTQDIPGGVLANITANYPIFKTKIIEPPTSTDYYYRIYYYQFEELLVPLAIKQLKIVTENDVSVTEPEFVINVNDFKKISEHRPGLVDTLVEMIIEKKSGAMETFKYNNTVHYKNNNLSKSNLYTDFGSKVNNHRYNDMNFYSELSFPGLSLSLSNNFMQGSSIKFLENFGFEFGLRKDKVLNLLEFQNPVFVPIGIHSYFKVFDSLFTDITFLVQKKFGNKKLLNKKNWWPVFDFDNVEINKASGVAFDAHFLGSLGNFKLPFINVYFSHSNVDFTDPVFRREISPNINQSFYSLNQVEFTLSFYWNSDTAKHNKFRLDIGGGTYDIYRVLYDKNNLVISDDEINGFIKWLPVTGLEYIHSSEKIEFGSSVRYFDSRVMAKLWLMLLKAESFEIRVEENFVSESFKKVLKDWEHEGSSSMMQLVLRYGLNN